MGIRDTFNRNPSVAVAICVVSLALVAGIWFVSAKEEGGKAAPGTAKSWYTIDDGRTWFADAPNRVVPFEHQGKQAYRCFVWTCDGGKSKFVSHLERISARARPEFAGKDKVQPWELIPGSVEVKAPLTGDTGWVDASLPANQHIQTPHCPGGNPGTPSPVPAE